MRELGPGLCTADALSPKQRDLALEYMAAHKQLLADFAARGEKEWRRQIHRFHSLVDHTQVNADELGEEVGRWGALVPPARLNLIFVTIEFFADMLPARARGGEAVGRRAQGRRGTRPASSPPPTRPRAHACPARALGQPADQSQSRSQRSRAGG